MASGLQLGAVLMLAIVAGCSSQPVEPGDSGHAGVDAVPSVDRKHHDEHLPSRVLTIRCESDHGLRRHCDLDASGSVVLSRRLSKTPCVQGRNWDVDARGVWVEAGCRAEFTRGETNSTGSASRGAVVRCESDNGRRHRCDASIVRGVELRRNVSHTPCIRGENWGWDSRGLWVDHGCRGEFEVF